MDVKNAFLHETLSEEVYMKPSPDTSPPPRTICSLPHALYRLKKAPRVPNLGLHPMLMTLHSSLVKTSHGIILLLYVVDMIITEDDPQNISNL